MRGKSFAILGFLLVGLAESASVDAGGTFETYDGLADAALAVQLTDLDGRPRRLGDHQGRVLLVNFWATWCSPCLTEMPAMQRLAEKMNGQPFDVVAINSSEPKKRVQRMAQRLKVKFPILLDPQGVAMSAWSVQVLPTTFLLDRFGKVRYRVVGPHDWDGEEARAVIEELLSEGLPADEATQGE
jgi:thiol-disulfide isomerase/thioredoxin